MICFPISYNLLPLLILHSAHSTFERSKSRTRVEFLSYNFLPYCSILARGCVIYLRYCFLRDYFAIIYIRLYRIKSFAIIFNIINRSRVDFFFPRIFLSLAINMREKYLKYYSSNVHRVCMEIFEKLQIQ